VTLGAESRVDDCIEVSESGTALVLRINGALDADSRDSIEPAVLAAIASGATAIIFDLRGLRFCDSHGVAMFIAAHDKAVPEQTELAIRHARPPIRKLFEITALHTRIPLID
jgi:anti-anti-sigma factor